MKNGKRGEDLQNRFWLPYSSYSLWMYWKDTTECAKCSSETTIPTYVPKLRIYIFLCKLLHVQKGEETINVEHDGFSQSKHTCNQYSKKKNNIIRSYLLSVIFWHFDFLYFMLFKKYLLLYFPFAFFLFIIFLFFEINTKNHCVEKIKWSIFKILNNLSKQKINSN